MNTQFERSNKTTIEWYTPPEIIHSLGEFDLDPCTSKIAYKLNSSAKNYYTKEDDGLTYEEAMEEGLFRALEILKTIQEKKQL